MPTPTRTRRVLAVLALAALTAVAVAVLALAVRAAPTASPTGSTLRPPAYTPVPAGPPTTSQPASRP